MLKSGEKQVHRFFISNYFCIFAQNFKEMTMKEEYYMTTEYVLEWCKKHCLPTDVVNERKRLADECADRFIEEHITDEIVQASEYNIVFTEDMFDVDGAFVSAMFKIGERYKDTADIEVAYSKPEVEDENGNKKVVVSFIVKNIPNINARKEREKQAAKKK